MYFRILRTASLCLAAGALSFAVAQEPVTSASSPANSAINEPVTPAGIAGSKQDPQAVARGGTNFKTYCAGCHGPAANGGPGAPNLVRSLVVLDDEKGILIAPVLREGRPDKGMPKLNLTEPQISDLVAWLHARTYTAGHRGTYNFANEITGDAKNGQAYFGSNCSGCHSTMGDLAGIGAKHGSLALQSLWLQPRSGHEGNAGPGAPSVTVTLPAGKPITGKLLRVDDFTVSLRDADGHFHSFSREQAGVQVAIQDPEKAHAELLRKYTDSDIHNVTAYLASLK